MPLLKKFISDEWRSRLENSVSPPIKTLEQLFISDPLSLALQLGCTADFIEYLKSTANNNWLNSLNYPPPIDNLDTKTPHITSWKDLPSSFPHESSSSSDPLLDFSISTGNSILNEMAGSNGFMRGQIHSFLSESGHGKTQTCLTIACNAVYSGHRVLVIDTNNSWNLSRIKSYFNYHLFSIALENETLEDIEQRNSKFLEMLSLFSIVRCFDLFKGMQLIYELSQRKTNETEEERRKNNREDVDPNSYLPYDIIILDSLYHWISPYLSTNREEVPILKTMTLKRKSSELYDETNLPQSSTNFSSPLSPLPSTIGTTISNLNQLKTITSTANVHPYLSHLNSLLRNLTNSTHCVTIVTNSLVVDSRFKIDLYNLFNSYSISSSSNLHSNININDIKSIYSNNLPSEFINDKKSLQLLRNNLISGLGYVTHESLGQYDTVWLLYSPSYNFNNNFNEETIKFRIQHAQQQKQQQQNQQQQSLQLETNENLNNRFIKYVDKTIINLCIIHRPPYLNMKPEYGEIILPYI